MFSLRMPSFKIPFYYLSNAFGCNGNQLHQNVMVDGFFKWKIGGIRFRAICGGIVNRHRNRHVSSFDCKRH